MTTTPLTKNIPRLHLDFLDGIRGLAALYVVLFHASLMFFLADLKLPHWVRSVLKPFEFGHFAVAVFIVLSGYCLMLPVALSADRQLRGGWRSYLSRRARRILPPYFAALAFSLLLMFWVTRAKQASGVALEGADHLTFGNVLSHLLLVHNWSAVYCQSIDPPLWSVAAEWQIYFFMPFLLLPLWRRFGLIVMVAAALVLGLAPHFFCPPAYSIDYVCPWYLSLFAFGMAGALLSAGRDLRLETLARRVPWGALSAVCAAVVLAGRLRHPGADSAASQWYMDVLCGLTATFLLVWCSRCAQAGQFRLTDALQSRPAMALGAMSYSVYLIHMPLEQIVVLTLCSHHLPFRLLVPAVFGVVVPAVLGVCYLFHLLFERPFMPGRPRTERAAEQSALVSPAP